MSDRLAGKVAVVTGRPRASGPGSPAASVVVNHASDRAEADRVVAEIIGKGGKAVAV